MLALGILVTDQLLKDIEASDRRGGREKKRKKKEADFSTSKYLRH